jgi:lipopolysaccharide transport system ATP-binding protein
MSTTQPIITVEGLSKVYRLGSGRDGSYQTLRESITEGLTRSVQRVSRAFSPTRTPGKPLNGATGRNGHSDDFRAIDDVSFEVGAGEVVGIIGRNGAGKSTLLKILSRVTEPTDGQITIHGRIGSLLEVGTGFHPELTGRENVYLNGAILGMSRREIMRKFDEIVAFAEIEKFLDTPVKRYSSGMYVRLAFAVASHLEPEILVIDEVLAVGDAEFQRKCLGKMGEVSRAGRTIIFVSHNMTAIKSLCSRGIYINGGRVVLEGQVDEVVDHYLRAGVDMSKTGEIPENVPRHQDFPGQAYFRSVRLTDLDSNQLGQLYFGQGFRIQFVCDVLKDIPDAHFEVSISTNDGTQVTYSTTMDSGRGSVYLARGRHEIICEPDVVLLPRDYAIDLGLHQKSGATADFVQRVLDFTVLRAAKNGDDHFYWPRSRGFVRPRSAWDFKVTTEGDPNNLHSAGVRRLTTFSIEDGK